MIYQKQTKVYDPGPPIFRGNCFTACVASIFDLDINSLPDWFGAEDPKFRSWLSIIYPGIAAIEHQNVPTKIASVKTLQRLKVPISYNSYWIAGVESSRFTEECKYHIIEGGKPHPPFWYKKEECPHCGGSGERPGFHAVVCKGYNVIHDPHPQAKEASWDSVGRLVGTTVFYAVDPSRLTPRFLPFCVRISEGR